MLPSPPLTDPDVQISRIRFFRRELRSRRRSDGRSWVAATGVASGTPPSASMCRRSDDPVDAVRDSLVEEAPQMAMVDRVEVTLDVDIDAPPHAAAHAGAAQSVERLVGGAAGPEAIRAGEEVLLVNRLQHHRDGPLCHLVFEGRDAERPLPRASLRIGS